MVKHYSKVGGTQSQNKSISGLQQKRVGNPCTKKQNFAFATGNHGNLQLIGYDQQLVLLQINLFTSEINYGISNPNKIIPLILC